MLKIEEIQEIGDFKCPQALQAYLENEGFSFIDKELVEREKEYFNSIFNEMRKKGMKNTFILTGKSDTNGETRNERPKFQAVRVVKNGHGDYHVQWVLQHDASPHDFIAMPRGSKKAVTVITASPTTHLAQK